MPACSFHRSPYRHGADRQLPARGLDERLSLHVRFSDDTETLVEPVGGFAGGAHLQRWRIRQLGGLAGTAITIEGLAMTFTDVLMRLERADGTSLSHRFTPDAPSYVVEASPSRRQVARAYLALGVEHILLGVDHLLFVLALILVVKDGKKLVGTVTVALAVFRRLRAVPVSWPRWIESIPAYGIGGIAVFWVMERLTAF